MDAFADYLEHIDNPLQRARMEEVFGWVLEKFPNLETKIAWKQPMFTDHGTYILGFSMAKQHMSVAPEQACMNRFADEIAKSGYSHTKELFRIRWDEPVQYELLEKLIAFNISDKAGCTTFWR